MAEVQELAGWFARIMREGEVNKLEFWLGTVFKGY
jgi:MOSC domain-containing protein YiiM